MERITSRGPTGFVRATGAHSMSVCEPTDWSGLGAGHSLISQSISVDGPCLSAPFRPGAT